MNECSILMPVYRRGAVSLGEAEETGGHVKLKNFKRGEAKKANDGMNACLKRLEGAGVTSWIPSKAQRAAHRRKILSALTINMDGDGI
jgi:hypothetical protein